MNSNIHQFSWSLFDAMPIVGIVRHFTMEEWINLLPIFFEEGFTNIEVTLNTPGAAKMIEHARVEFGNAINIGAGTVCTLEDYALAIAAGASFIVTPIVVKEVIEKAVESGVPIFPGAFTPTEIYTAWNLGASMIKVFPASSLGPDFIKSVKAPLPNIKLMPTGGIGLDNMKAYKNAGADGLGIGSPIFPTALIQLKNENNMRKHFKAFKEQWEMV